MIRHDPKQMVENLRAYMATHDRQLSFLFGAGTSSSINIAPEAAIGRKPEYQPLIPGIIGLTELCGRAVSALGDEETEAWNILVSQCKSEGKTGNVEDILSKVRIKMDAIGEGERLVGLSAEQLSTVESEICKTIAKIVNPEEDIIPSHTPHDYFASWIKKISRTAPLEIFTTNYDVLFERAFESSRVPIFDGFVGTHHPFFFPECLEDEDLLPKPRWVRLWKLHGSVSWRLKEVASCQRVIRSNPGVSGELILPSQRKYDESRKQPYVAYMDRLSRILKSDYSLLITCGYSFGDDHINAIIYSSLDNKPTVNVMALMYQDIEEDHELVKAAIGRPNLTVLAPNGGVIAGKCGMWQLTQPVDNKICAFMDIAFDSNANPENDISLAGASEDLRGRLRLGDFKWFCNFLNIMGPDSI